MREMERFVQSAVLLIIVALVSVFSTDVPYLCILFTGLLFILLTIRSLSDKKSILFIVAQFIVTVAFCVVANNIFAWLICFEFRFEKLKCGRVCIPAVLYGAVQFLEVTFIQRQQQSLPVMICNMLIILAGTVLICIAEYLITGYISAKVQITQAVSVTAVNEMYEKKLNRELIIKNYLADKNARLEERENISRNIHNSVGHSITAAIMTLDAADMLFDTSPDKAREKVKVANERIRTSLSSIRHAVRVLDGGSELISFSDLVKELMAVADSFMMDTAIQISTDFQNGYNDLSIPHEHTEFLTGALKELLTNGVRHGQADRFVVRLVADSGHVRLFVLDNGKSDFSETNQTQRIADGFGLKKLISYVGKCGGSAVFANNNGFSADIMLPLIKEAEDEQVKCITG